MTNLSDKIFGVGGTFVPDIIVDASGKGDYTSIQTAVNASSDSDVIFVRNGIYNETGSIQLKFGTKLIGESKEGVKLNSTSSSVIQFKSNVTSIVRTQRTTNNLGSDQSGGLGTISLTNGSATATKSGSSGIATGWKLAIGVDDIFTLSNVSGNTLTLDRPWRGPTNLSAPIPDRAVGIAFQSTLGVDDYNLVSNMTIESSSSGAGCCYASGVFRPTIINCHFICNNTSVNQNTGAFAFYQSIFGRVIDCSAEQTVAGNCHSIYSCFGLVMRGYKTKGSDSNFISGGTIAPNNYLDLEYESISSSYQYFVNNSLPQAIDSRFHIKRMVDTYGWANTPSGSSEPYVNCHFKFDVCKLIPTNGISSFHGRNNTFEFGNWYGGGGNANYLSVKSSADSSGTSTTNLIISGRLDLASSTGLQVDGSVIIGGSVIYTSLLGTPKQNGGFSF